MEVQTNGIENGFELKLTSKRLRGELMKLGKIFVLGLTSVVLISTMALSLNAASVDTVGPCGVHHKHNGSYEYDQAYAQVAVSGSGSITFEVALYKNGSFRVPATTTVYGGGDKAHTATCESGTLQGSGASFGYCVW